MLLTIGSGSLLYLTAPLSYINNPAFVPKIALLLAALGLQAALSWRGAPARPLLARSVAALSLTLWFGVGLAGRAIGFV